MDITRWLLGVIREILQTAFVSLLIFLVVYVFLMQPHRVKGDSMLPNFRDGELILSEKINYRFGSPGRGDVIVFRAPTGRKVDFIKRIVGLDGDVVRVEDGIVYINDKILSEPYETQKTQGTLNIKLQQDQYFVLGDNRSSSSDSRSFGPISRGSIRGRAWLVYWPIFRAGDFGGLRIISRINYSIPDAFYDR